MTTPATGNREFRDEVVRLAELTVTTSLLDGYTFVNCSIIGPAVLILLNRVNIHHCTWDGDVNSIFWLVEPGRTYVVGGIGLQNCEFSACKFQQVGVAGHEQLRQTLTQGFS